MKKSLLLLAFALFQLSALAQTESSAGRLSLNFGMAVPVGDFRQPDFEDEYPVFAKSGTLLSLGYAKDLQPYLAVGASFNWRSNPFDFEDFYIRNDDYKDRGEADTWRTYFTMADVYAQLPSQGVALYIKGSAGAAFSRTAGYEVRTDFGTIQQEAHNSTSFAWGLGIGLRQEFGHLGLNIEADFLGTRPTFKAEDKGRETTYTQQLNSVGISLGLSYSL